MADNTEETVAADDLGRTADLGDVVDLEGIDDLADLEEVADLEDVQELEAVEATTNDGQSDEDEELDDDLDADEESLEERLRGEPFSIKKLIKGMGACTFSLLIHLILLLVLGTMVMPGNVKTRIKEILVEAFEDREEELVEVELEQDVQAATEQTMAVFSSSPALGVQGAAAAVNDAPPQLEYKFVEKFDSAEVTIEAPTLSMPSSKKLIEAIPEGDFKGDPRAIVDNYQQAMDRITQEIMWSLDKGPVLVCWCFDQSESMKDDQKEIRDRIHRVYQELGLGGGPKDDHLLTAVTSYGANFVPILGPTSDRDQIRHAIDSVPIDPSGKEMMCNAVGRSIAALRSKAKGGRQMMLILVTDESGEPEDSYQYLEQAVAEAKAAKCRIYCMGREAVFGYPFAHMRWKHPQTGRTHWLPVNRGPETGFPQQLQTNGFRRRFDAFASGFGPYEQCRMCKETGGIYFMLPSLESALVRAQGNNEDRRYELEKMRAYKVDLRSRQEVFADRDRYPMRTLMWKIVHDLDPHNKASQSILEVRMAFSPDLPTFVKQVRTEQAQAMMLIKYFGMAQKAIEDGIRLREQEANPRWQGNYDLIHAQLVAYQARLFEYGSALEAFMRNPKIVPLTKPPDYKLVHWDVHTTQKTITEEAKPYIERSKYLFEQVIATHPGTPWEARARWELKRGFGVHLVEDYDRPYRYTGSAPLKPVPKL